jgi:hypothetical protein
MITIIVNTIMDDVFNNAYWLIIMHNVGTFIKKTVPWRDK